MDINVGMLMTAGLWVGITIGIWIVGKILTKSLYIPDPGAKDYAAKVTEVNKVFNIFAKILTAVWIIGMLILFGLGGTTVNEKSADMGSTQATIEAEEYVPQTAEEISKGNAAMLRRDDEQREKEVAAEQKKSRDEFNSILQSVRTPNTSFDAVE